MMLLYSEVLAIKKAVATKKWSQFVLAIFAGMVLQGCDRGKVEKLEAENTKLKGELEKVQEQVRELATKQKQEVASQAEEKAKQKREQELKEYQAQEAARAQAIGKCFDRIRLQMRSLMDEPRDFAFKNKSTRAAIESRLKSLANSTKSNIGEIIIELKGINVASTSDLEYTVSSFVGHYNSMILSERTSYDLIELGSEKHEEYTADTRKAMQLAYADISKLDEIKRYTK